MRGEAKDGCGCGIEVHGFSWEPPAVVLARLHRALAASGCWIFHCGGRDGLTLEYSLDAELSVVMELYCGLVQAGLELTEVSHRALTELCILSNHERALGGSLCLTPRVINLQLRLSFLESEEMGLTAMMVASG